MSLNLDDRGAVESAVVYDALLTFMTKLEILPHEGLAWLNFRIFNAIQVAPIDSAEQVYLRAALELVRKAINA